MKNALTEDIFSTWLGKSWRNLLESDLEVFPAIQKLNATYHQYVLVSGESFAEIGRETVDVFLTEDLLLNPSENEGNNCEDKIVIIAFNEGKDLLMLTEKVEEVDMLLSEVDRMTSAEIFYGCHKVTSEH